jgi:hypothetical protein
MPSLLEIKLLNEEKYIPLNGILSNKKGNFVPFIGKDLHYFLLFFPCPLILYLISCKKYEIFFPLSHDRFEC